MMYNYKAFLRRSTAVLLAAALMLSNIINGVGAIDGYAYGTNWSIDSLGDSYDDESLYEEVQKMYCTDLYGLPASEQEIWSQGSMDDIEVEYDTLNYADDMSSADVRVYVIPRDENVKISGVRQAGYFGDDNIATSSNAIATASDASDSNATGYAYDFTIFNNKPAFVIYYTVAEDADGDAVATDSEADTDHEESYVWVSAYDELTDIGVVLPSGIIAPELSANLVDLYHAYTAADTTALTDMLTAGVTDEAGNKIDNLTIDTTELGQFFEGITVSADMSAELTTNGYTADIAGLVAYYDATIAAATEGADTTDPTVKEQIDAFKKDIYATAFADYMGQKTSVVISRSDDTSATRSIVIATEVSSIATMGITQSADDDYIKLSSSNTVMTDPSAFAIGKTGTYRFTFDVRVNANTLPNAFNTGKVVEVTIPQGFALTSSEYQLNSTPTVGESYKIMTDSDGNQLLIIKIPDSMTQTFKQGFQVQQNATYLINNLADSQGTYDFDMKLYVHYDEADKTLVETGIGTDITSRLTLQGDATTPDYTVTIDKGTADDTWNPNQILNWRDSVQYQEYGWSHNLGRTYDQGVEHHIGPSDTLQWLSRDTSFAISIHKSEGYITDDASIVWSYPGTDIFKDTSYVGKELLFTSDDGETTKIPIVNADWDKVTSNKIQINPAKLSGKAGTNDYNDADTSVPGLSYGELLHKAGTLTVVLSPNTYINRLYKGDWNQTSYIAATPVQFADTDFTDGSTKTNGTEKLHFNYIQGTSEPVIDLGYPHSEIQVTKLMQYKAATPQWNDSEWQEDRMLLRVDADWMILDNLKLTYEYEQFLNPVELQNLRCEKADGFTYRIYVTDAVTGNLSRIETIVGEEEYPSYTAQTIDGIAETVIDGGACDASWKLAEADTVGNTLYVSKIEVIKDRYNYNNVGSQQNGRTWFDYKLRAYHSYLSDSTKDFPSYDDTANGGRACVIKRSIVADNMTEDDKTYTVQTFHDKDNISIVVSSYPSWTNMEVNSHTDSSLASIINISKYKDTMEYNVDSQGAHIPYGAVGYDPVVVEYSGDAVTVIDRMEYTTGDGSAKGIQRLLGVTGPDGTYYDLAEHGIDADDYLVDTQSRWSDTAETSNLFRAIGSSFSNNHTSFYDRSGKEYKLNEIYDKLGIKYATTLVAAIEDINEWQLGGADRVSKEFALGINKVYPGYLNYDNVIGITSEADPDVTVSTSAAIYCKYSDYRAELTSNTPVDTNGGNNHGTAKKATAKSFVVTYGNYATDISLRDDDYYVQPYSTTSYIGDGHKEAQIYAPSMNWRYNAIVQPNDARYMMLTEIEVNNQKDIQIQYKDAEIDFDGTDSKLLSLTNAISFSGKLPNNPNNDGGQGFLFTLEYTLSDGQTKTVTDSVASDTHNNTLYYTIPDVDIANGVYLTSLKVSFPNDMNWGANNGKADYKDYGYSVRPMARIPDVGLVMYHENVPSVYPGTTIKIGTQNTDSATGRQYDKLDVKASIKFSDVMGNELADGTGDYATSGKSNRISGMKSYVDFFQIRYQNYQTVSSEQGADVIFESSLGLGFSKDTRDLAFDKKMTLRPTFYYKIDKDYTYVNGSLYNVPEGTTAQFIKAGTGVGQSGDADYGILKVTWDGVDDSKLRPMFDYRTGYEGSYMGIYDPRFKLKGSYNASLGEGTPITDVWADVAYDANRDGSYAGNASGVPVELGNGRDLLKDDAPYGSSFDNTNTALDSNNNGLAEMLKKTFTVKHTITEKIITGINPYVIATTPYDENQISVTSKDITAIDNLYGDRIYLTGADNSSTSDWEVYVPTKKLGDIYAYDYSNSSTEEVRHTEANQFGMDIMDVDTTDLVDKTLDFVVWYTTDANPAEDGYTSNKAAHWTAWQGSDTSVSYTVPADTANITGIKVTIKQIQTNLKVFFIINYKLHEHKSVIGEQVDQTMTYVNFRMGDSTSPYYFGDKGSNYSKAQEYHLTDMSMTGFVWDESDYNSTYNNGETKVSGVTMDLYDTDGTTKIEQTGNAAAITNANGAYTLIVPHDGTVNVKINLPDGKKLVNKQVNSDATIDSAFDRDTQNAQITFVANAIKNAYNCPDVNAGIYDKPVINVTVVPEDTHIVDGVSTAQVDVDHKVPGTMATFTQDTATGDYTITDNGDETATISTGKLTGVYYGKSSIDDGYGGTEETTFPIVIYNNVKYDANTGTGTPVTDNKHYYPSTAADGTDAQTDVATVKDDTGISKTGYTFAGWATTASATAADYQPGDTTTLGSVTGDVTLYAVWTANQYTVKYLANDLDTAGVALDYAGTANTTSADGTTADSVHTYDVAKKLTKNGYSIPGYTWVEWNLAKNGTSTSFTDEQSVINLSSAVDGVVYMNAQWRAHQYEVIFDGNGAKSGSTANENFTYGTAKNLNTNGFARPGYIFMGWNTASDSNAALYTDGQSVKNLTTDDNGKVTLYAIWAEKDDVVINYVSADTVMGSVSLASEALKPATGVATGSDAIANPGYTFVEWQQTTDGQPVATPTDAHIIPQKDADELNVSGTYTAVFRENTYTVKFDKNGADGTETMGSMNLTYTELIKLLKNMYTNSGYMFGGWNTEADGSGQSFMDQAMIDKLTTDDAGVVTLYAQWIDTDAVITQDPPIKKIVTKAASSQDLAAGEDYTYKFSMVPSPADAPMPVAVVGVTELQADGSLLATITGAAEGTYGVEFGDMTYTKPGTYSYTLSEVKGENTRFTYDTNTYTMTVVISWEDAARTKLQKTVTYTKADGTVVDSMDFTNEYNRPRQNSSGDDSSSSSPSGGHAVGDNSVPSGAGASIGGGSDLFGIGPDGIPLSSLIINGIPKTGEEWAHAWMYLLMITGLFGAAIALIKRRSKTN